MELREMLVIIGLVLIAVIVWDGIRRMRSRKSTRYSGSYTRAKETDDYEDPDELKRKAELNRELPNGGARIRHMTPEERAQLTSRLNLRERVPMLMDSVEVAPEPEEEAPAPRTGAERPAKQQSLDFDNPVDPPAEDTYPSEPQAEEAQAPESEPEQDFSHSQDDEPRIGDWHFSAEDDFEPDFGDIKEADDDSVAESETAETEVEAEEPEQTSEPEQKYSNIWAEEEPAETAPSERDAAEDSAETWPEPEQPVRSPKAAATKAADKTDAADDQYEEDTRPVEELVIMHIMAKGERDIAGSELLELLLRAGLRYGPMDIFHYRNPKGQLEFSLANSVQPGTLNPDTMEQMTTPGITLFMQLPQHADMMTSFDHLYEMAVFLAKQLDAAILDEEHSTVTAQRVEHYRERLRNFARTQLIQAHE